MNRLYRYEHRDKRAKLLRKGRIKKREKWHAIANKFTSTKKAKKSSELSIYYKKDIILLFSKMIIYLTHFWLIFKACFYSCLSNKKYYYFIKCFVVIKLFQIVCHKSEYTQIFLILELCQNSYR